ncbi:Rrf2 family transcriptional regulator [Wenyingzhuangia fucanilytica]|uniref:Rrf2 family transcriptional regulator n=1 Tax=Wenyingzhuangia fucanilytica TaxID=1790137 RepID=A0A1B1Y787_9FLAO|nr:Rrf2 family transcriptional regulator [Wenyingzhuangia fucanilytica]ANW96651.1 Rrf2 family transcriptional regulator [Wenyingzhuangia fucanilytica]
MLSKACKYAVRAILYLAINSDESKKIGIKKIAEALETPQPFLAKLLQQLSTHHLVSSSKGPGGGFYLTEKDLEITLWDIVLNIDGAEKFNECFLGLSVCSDSHPCPAHHIVKPFRDTILCDFKHKNILQLKEEIENKGTFLSLKLLVE